MRGKLEEQMAEERSEVEGRQRSRCLKGGGRNR